MDLDGRVYAAGGGAADQQRQLEALPLVLGGDVAHLVERGRDQAGQPDEVGVFCAVSRIFAAGTITPRSTTS